MSDAEFARPEPPVDAAAEAVEALREHRLARERAGPVADEPVAEPAATKLTDGEKSELSPQRDRGLLAELRRVEAERARAYADALGAGERMDGAAAGQSGEPSAEQQPPTDPDLIAQQQAADAEIQRQSAEAERDVERRISELGASAQQLASTVRAAAAELAAAFPDIKTAEDAQRLAASDPYKYALYEQSKALLDAGVRHVHSQLTQQQELRKSEWDRISASNDAYWESLHPELKTDPAKHQQIIEGAQRVLDHVKIADNELRDLWEGRATVSLRDWRVQEVLALAGEAMRGRAALEQARVDGRGRNLPPVLKPGQRAERADSAHAQFESARRLLDRNPEGQAGIRAAMAMMRAARGVRDGR